jgi:hypothetical protein
VNSPEPGLYYARFARQERAKERKSKAAQKAKRQDEGRVSSAPEHLAVYALREALGDLGLSTCPLSTVAVFAVFRGFWEVRPAAGQGPGVGSRQENTPGAFG